MHEIYAEADGFTYAEDFMDRTTEEHGARRSVAATWLRVLWRCWQDNAPYEPARHRPS
jgi:hypothetical protein